MKTAVASLKVTNAHNGRLYRCIVTDANNNKATSNPATITVVRTFTENKVVYYLMDDGNLRVNKYNGTSASVTIPETIRNRTVTEIGEKAFEGNTSLTSIDLPDTIQIIRKRAFANCTALSSMS